MSWPRPGPGRFPCSGSLQWAAWRERLLPHERNTIEKLEREIGDYIRIRRRDKGELYHALRGQYEAIRNRAVKRKLGRPPGEHQSRSGA